MKPPIQVNSENLVLFESLQILWANKKWVIGIPLLAMLLAAMIVFSMPDQYAAQARIKPGKDINTLLGIVNTAAVIEHLDPKLGLITHYQLNASAELPSVLEEKIETAQTKEGFLAITATDSSAQFAADLANAYAQALILAANTQYLTEESKHLHSLHIQLVYTREKLQEAIQQTAQPEMAKILNQLPNTMRFAIDSVGELHAEVVILRDGDSVKAAEGEVMRLADIEHTRDKALTAKIVDKLQLGTDPAAYEAILLLQRKAFLKGLENKLTREIALQETTLKDEIKIMTPAIAPQHKAGPARLMIILVSGIATLFLTILGVLCVGNLLRMKRDADKLNHNL